MKLKERKRKVIFGENVGGRRRLPPCDEK